MNQSITNSIPFIQKSVVVGFKCFFIYSTSIQKLCTAKYRIKLRYSGLRGFYHLIMIGQLEMIFFLSNSNIICYNNSCNVCITLSIKYIFEIDSWDYLTSNS